MVEPSESGVSRRDESECASLQARSFLETLKDGVAVVDANRMLTGFNSAYLKQFDLPADALQVGDSLETMLRRIAETGGLPAGLAAEQAIAQRLAAWGTEADRRERRYLANGRVQDIYRSPMESGEIISVHVDVTESLRRDRELELQRLYMESIIENLSDGVVLVDTEGFFIAFNTRFLELYRIDPGKAHWGMHVSELSRIFGDLDEVSPEERRIAREERMRFAVDPESTRIFRHLGDGRTLDVIKSVLPGGGCVMTIRDVTEDLARKHELEDARLRAEESNRHKSQFLARMSHEIRTPLNGVLGVAALLKATELDRRQRDLVDVIVSSGDTLVRLIDDILDLNHIESGRLTLCEEPFSPCKVMRESIALIEPVAERKGLAVHKRPSPVPVPLVLGDPVRLKQILLNLLGNAVKFTETGSVTIGLDAAPVPGGISLGITVSDTGIGIPRAERAAVFRDFYQVGNPSGGRGGGVGLGLTVTKGLVDAMGGTIRLDGNEAHGKTGTSVTVSLVLPLAEPFRTAAAG